MTEVWSTDCVGVRLSPNGDFNDMGSPDYRQQFSHAATILSGLELAYLHVMDGLGFGFHELGEPMTLAELRKLYAGRLMGNCGYDYESAQLQISSGDADLISFGRPYIANPDLVQRFVDGIDLRPDPGMEYWYSDGPKGYVDFDGIADRQSENP